MKKYILTRLLLFIPTLLGISLGIFLLLRVIPGDPAAIILGGRTGDASYTQEDLQRLRHSMGLDKPIYVQYMAWMSDLLRGNLGTSIALNRPIAEELRRQFPVSLQLGVLTIIVIWCVAIPIGVLSAVKQDKWVDYVARGLSILGLAMPGFFVGLVIILVLSRFFHWLPPFGFKNLWDAPAVSIQQLIFPALALGFQSSGTLMRITRTQLLEVLKEDYVRTAYAKGLASRTVIWRHAVRNSLLPVVTVAGTQMGLIFTGTVVVEQIFSIPGVGRGFLGALSNRDMPMIQAYVVYFTVVVLFINLIVDISYAWLDPRIRYG